MSRFRGPKGKIVRRFGVNIYGNPKFDGLLEKKPHAPGAHGANGRRRKVSEYGQQLAEKQKLKYTYGMREKQFRVLFKKAFRKPGITGDNMLIMLESRFDNVIYRATAAPTRDAARQMILHGHLKVNGRRTNIASYSMREGDVVSVKDSDKSRALVRRFVEGSSHRAVPEWVDIDRDNLVVTFVRSPLREEIQSIADEQVVVELYSK
jgi:small subunit ribosomal protein S4